MLLYIFLFLLTILSTVLLYLVYNLSKKVSIYEESIENFYEQISITLHIMRSIDNRKMFEADDEVGQVFIGLSEAVDMLRPIIYGAPDGEEEN